MGTYFSPMLNMHFSSKEQAEAFEKEAILRQQIKHNELIKEQNRILNESNYNNSYTSNYNITETSLLDTLAVISVVPIILGIIFIITQITGSDATILGIRSIIGGLVFPSIYWVKSKRSVISVFAMTFIIIGFIFSLMIK